MVWGLKGYLHVRPTTISRVSGWRNVSSKQWEYMNVNAVDIWDWQKSEMFISPLCVGSSPACVRLVATVHWTRRSSIGSCLHFSFPRIFICFPSGPARSSPPAVMSLHTAGELESLPLLQSNSEAERASLHDADYPWTWKRGVSPRGFCSLCRLTFVRTC